MPLSNVCEFGRALLDNGDLDPLYVLIGRTGFDRNSLAKCMLAYWCFYNTGTVSWILDQQSYWDAMAEAADTSVHPRGGDRRHFRGDLSRSTVACLRESHSDPAELLDWMCYHGQRVAVRHVMFRVQTLRGFGVTVAFKVADMLERLWIARYRFGEGGECLLMSKTPRAGAETVFPTEPPTDAVRKADALLRAELREYLVPPRYDRPPTVLETETVLCKWKHHLGGTYYVGKGKRSQLEGLLRYPSSPTARRMLRAGVEAELWGEEDLPLGMRSRAVGESGRRGVENGPSKR